ncbi:hypothetical protein F2P81_002949 [Scophthalmus maximus]|uniref:Uncharacterized protein n=1 Tax=Scophthalmus maximus TaxID=52904 RepID=A0A6A4TLP3_SCOMX|nr:hypothetical protein F2P81_002949 [Scophthalmus maximus]
MCCLHRVDCSVVSFGRRRVSGDFLYKRPASGRRKTISQHIQYSSLRFDMNGRDEISVAIKTKHGFKPIGGKTLPLHVEPQWSSEQQLSPAWRKLKDFNQDMKDGKCVLLCPDGSQTTHIPGTETPFTIEKYKEAVGKAYQGPHCTSAPLRTRREDHRILCGSNLLEKMKNSGCSRRPACTDRISDEFRDQQLLYLTFFSKLCSEEKNETLSSDVERSSTLTDGKK